MGKKIAINEGKCRTIETVGIVAVTSKLMLRAFDNQSGLKLDLNKL